MSGSSSLLPAWTVKFACDLYRFTRTCAGVPQVEL